MRTRSAKQKGKRLENRVVEILKQSLSFTEEDVRRVAASVTGKDIILSKDAEKVFPFSLELKNTEKLNIWAAIKQSQENCTKNTLPAVIFSRNHSKDYIVLELEDFINIWKLLFYSMDEDKIIEQLCGGKNGDQTPKE